MASRALLVVFTLSALSAFAQPVDLSVIHRIKAEALENSKVMEHVFYLSDANGPRLTNFPGFRSAGEWVMKRLKEYGLANVHEETWGPFGRGWNYTHFDGSMIAPVYAPLIGFPLAWSPGTNGPVEAEAIYAPLETEGDFAQYKGKLRGKIVLTMKARDLVMPTEPAGRRYTDAELVQNIEPGRLPNLFRPLGPAQSPQQKKRIEFTNKSNQFLKEEGALVVVHTGTVGDAGDVFGQAGGSRDPKDPVPPPMVVVTPEHYNRVVRLLAHNIPVKLQFDIQAQFIDSPTDSFNVIGEIPGGRKKDEIVMLGAHLDSWHGGTGATDNGTGSAVAIEAVRILQALNLKMDRTVRVAFWGGEEEGLLGSKAYVTAHFADRETMQPKPEYFKLSAYYNDDTGTGRFRGINAVGNDEAMPIFEEWLKPFHDLGATTVTGVTSEANRRPNATDHTSFAFVGLPGFNFVQDPMDYFTRTHHSNMDVYDRVQPGDMMQCAAIMAAFVYNTAMRDQMMPRVPMPKPIANTESTTK
ncbi:MAG TPA: M20/M25/M40 family metallo-hydrolase [Bryobacteraceae bacterium]|nr:M20/M25/M40 family metallo-hydrolase [Bryobacteraceae bacterium]